MSLTGSIKKNTPGDAISVPALMMQLSCFKAQKVAIGVNMLMTINEYATYRAITRQTVYNWIKKGKIVMSGSKVDFDATESIMAAQKEEGKEKEKDIFHISCKQAADFVWSNDCEKEYIIASAITKKVKMAAIELNYDVLDDPKKRILTITRDDNEKHSFHGKDRKPTALNFFRYQLAYMASTTPDQMDDWSVEGLMAFCL